MKKEKQPTSQRKFMQNQYNIAPETAPVSTANLVRNFLDCIRSRQATYCPPEEGHRSTSLAHLATIALITRERLEWDGSAERFLNSGKANQLLEYEYGKPYQL